MGSIPKEERYVVQRQPSAEYPFVVWDRKHRRLVNAHETAEQAEEMAKRLNFPGQVAA